MNALLGQALGLLGLVSAALMLLALLARTTIAGVRHGRWAWRRRRDRRGGDLLAELARRSGGGRT